MSVMDTGLDAQAAAINRARLRKAIKIETVLRQVGATSYTVEKLSVEGRRNAEVAAGVTSPSSESTWGLVLHLMKHYDGRTD